MTGSRCAEWRELAFTVIDGGLAAEQMRGLSAHLEECSACRDAAAAAQAVAAALRAGREVPAPAAFRERTLAAYDQAIAAAAGGVLPVRLLPAPSEPRPSRRWIPLAAAAAALLFFMLWRAELADRMVPAMELASAPAAGPGAAEVPGTVDSLDKSQRAPPTSLGYLGDFEGEAGDEAGDEAGVVVAGEWSEDDARDAPMSEVVGGVPETDRTVANKPAGTLGSVPPAPPGRAGDAGRLAGGSAQPGVRTGGRSGDPAPRPKARKSGEEVPEEKLGKAQSDEELADEEKSEARDPEVRLPGQAREDSETEGAPRFGNAGNDDRFEKEPALSPEVREFMSGLAAAPTAADALAFAAEKRQVVHRGRRAEDREGSKVASSRRPERNAGSGEDRRSESTADAGASGDPAASEAWSRRREEAPPIVRFLEVPAGPFVVHRRVADWEARAAIDGDLLVVDLSPDEWAAFSVATLRSEPETAAPASELITAAPTWQEVAPGHFFEQWCGIEPTVESAKSDARSSGAPPTEAPDYRDLPAPSAAPVSHGDRSADGAPRTSQDDDPAKLKVAPAVRLVIRRRGP
jgi:hypothetical protein